MRPKYSLPKIEKRCRRLWELYIEAELTAVSSRIPVAFQVFHKARGQYVNYLFNNDRFLEITNQHFVGIVLKDMALGLKLYKLDRALSIARSDKWLCFIDTKAKINKGLYAINKKYKLPEKPLEYRQKTVEDDLVALYVSMPWKRGTRYAWRFDRFTIPSLDPEGLNIPEFEEIDHPAGDSSKDSAARI
jgi:hypothetical protein